MNQKLTFKFTTFASHHIKIHAQVMVQYMDYNYMHLSYKKEMEPSKLNV